MKNLICLSLMVIISMVTLNSCQISGVEINPPLIIAIVTAIYEVVIRLVPTSSKWFSIIEIIYKIITIIIPNRTRDN